MSEKSAADSDERDRREKREIERLKTEIKKLEAQVRKLKTPRELSMERRQRAAKARMKARMRSRDRAHFKSRFSTRRSFPGRNGGGRPFQGGLCNGE